MNSADIKSAIMCCPHLFDESDVVRVLSWRMSRKQATRCQRKLYTVLKQMTDDGELVYHPKFAKYEYVDHLNSNNSK